MARNLEWCICILKRQIGLLEPGVCFLWRLQCWRFLQFQRLWRRCHPAGNSKIRKKIYFAFLVKRNQFFNYLGRGFNIPEYKGNKFFDPKSLSGFYRGHALR